MMMVAMVMKIDGDSDDDDENDGNIIGEVIDDGTGTPTHYLNK